MSTNSIRAGEAEWHPSFNPWLIATAVMVAVFMEVLDTTITSVALPNMAGSLSATNEEATWVLTSYLVANASCFRPAAGWPSASAESAFCWHVPGFLRLLRSCAAWPRPCPCSSWRVSCRA